MTFVASKVLWYLVQPGNFLILLLTLGVLLQVPCRPWARKLGRRVTALSAVLLLAIAILPFGNWLLLPLESRFPAREPPARVDGIVMLGGAIIPALSQHHGQPALNDAAERVTAFMALARRYPDARLVFTGGSGLLFGTELKEADVVRQMMIEQGFDLDRILFERESRNTFENAIFSRDLVKPEPGETWLLVTSAFHMPRSIGIYRKVGWQVEPFPVDFRTQPTLSLAPDFNFLYGLIDVHDGLREWIGLAAYRIMGRTDALLPGPG